MAQSEISEQVIEKFLEGRDPQKYIVGIEATYNENKVSLIINDPELGKYIETHKYKPFLYLKHSVAGKMYGGNKTLIRKAMERWGVKIKALKVDNDEGHIPARMENGYKYIAICNESYNNLLQFFKQGGVDIFGGERLFLTLTPSEQFLIQTGKRLFKGMDDYNDLHRLQFDLETTGLNPRVDSIFQIGVRDNKGFESITDVSGETPQEKRDSERDAIIKFFKIIDELKPDVITGYYSENFDWDFIYKRCEILYIDIEKIAKTLSPNSKIARKDSTLKLGGETEHYTQTYMWGYSILDIIHAVRRAQAINSDIKEGGLKYITKFSNVAKVNRVYVKGDILNTTWADKINKYYLDDTNGDWFKYDAENPNHITKIEPVNSPYKEVTGKYIVERYLLDDLWETEQIDSIYNQASFLLSKIIPTSYMRSSTMGTAGTWKLIMLAWSYENNLAIPDFEPKRDFTGGLSRLLEVGWARRVVKLDFAALYPKIQLTDDIFPDLDISGVMKGLLTYVVDTRDKYKFLTGDEKSLAKKLEKELDSKRDTLTPSEINALEIEIDKHKRLSSDYDKKQLPLKILANSFFGSFGAPYIFPWGDTNSAEETTCRGRQNLRLMVRHFKGKYGFRPLVGDTDGFNFAIPDNIDEVKYLAKGDHWKTEKYAGQELVGLDAVLAEFNENYMVGRMGLDIDDVCNATINFARKNYANDIDGKIKFVGNSIKSKTMPIYIEEFLDKGIRLLLDGKGYEFLEYYYEYVEKIATHQIPLVKIASKKKVKQTVDDYINTYCRAKNKAGNLKSRQAHMELAIQHNLNIKSGDVIYYVNTGDVKSHGDIKTKKDANGKQVIELKCKLIPTDQIEKNPELTTDEYNVPKYLNAFNTRIETLLVCFNPTIRDSILIDVNKDKKTKEFILDNRPVFTKKECEMDSGNPFEEGDQDSYEELMTMEDKEIRFWSSVNKIPNYMEESEWKAIEADWKERMRQERIDGIVNERNHLQDIFKRFEVNEIEELKSVGILPKSVLAISRVDDHKTYGPSFYSNKWDVFLCPILDLFKYEDVAIERANFYLMNYELLVKVKPEDKYDKWLEQTRVLEIQNGPSKSERFNPNCSQKLCCSEEWDGNCPCYEQFNGDKDKLNEYLKSELVKNDEATVEGEITIEPIIKEDTEIVSTQIEPDIEEDDGWNF